jgi:uncharacterized membrane protein YhaH (DUF805 family)
MEYGLSIIVFVILYGLIAVFTEFATVALLGFVPVFWFFYAQGAKRCHDLGKSGWFQLIPFYAFWMIFVEGHDQVNRYGCSPKL